MAADEGWLDMSRYPDLDPDEALAPEVLGRLRDILLGHEPLERGSAQHVDGGQQ
jgi:hypothetical protein